MKKLFIEPSMDIKTFADENVVTSSGGFSGTSVDRSTVNNEEYQIMTLDVMDDLGFTF